MEELLEFLNEYAHTYADHYDDTGKEIEIKFLEHTDNCFIYHCDGKFDSLVDDTVISNRFGFIKRLVENNKIDFNKLEKIGHEETVYEYDGQYKKIVEYSNYETLLMLLSISDTPIEDLILYLK